MYQYLPDLVLCAVLLICLYTDLRQRRIYNKVIFAAILLGFMLSFHAHGASGLLQSVEGFLLGAGLLLLPFAAGGMGAGDLKLLATIGLYKGAVFTFHVFLLAAVLGGVFAVLLLLRRRKLIAVLKDIQQGVYILLCSSFKINVFPSMHQSEGEILLPYAPMLVIASFLVYFLV
ncbi:MAG: prepilin peptidase [Bacillota bacterium]